jgi:hypothetical protein
VLEQEADGAVLVLLCGAEREEHLGRVLVEEGPLALPKRALVDRDPEPGEVAQDPLLGPLLDAGSVGVVDAKYEHAPVSVGEAPVRPGGERAPEMERAGRARSEAETDHVEESTARNSSRPGAKAGA